MGEMVIILVVALLIFGPSKLPQLGDALGKGIRSFKRATSGADEEPAPALAAADPAPAAPERKLESVR
jgi:sec-independent protein translocase protein TatA